MRRLDARMPGTPASKTSKFTAAPSRPNSSGRPAPDRDTSRHEACSHSHRGDQDSSAPRPIGVRFGVGERAGTEA